MAITESNRYQLFQRLEKVLGTEEATTLMEHLPPVGWADVATKTDLDGTRTLLRTDLDHLRTETTAGLAQLRTEMTSEFALVRSEMTSEFALVRSEMTSEFALVRSEMTSEFALVRSEMTSEFALVRSEIGTLESRVDAKLEHGFREQTRTLVLANLGTTLALGSLILAAVRL